MNSDITYQNQDLGNQNPLAPVDNISLPPDVAKKPTDPKIKILKILVTVIVILLFVSLLISIIKKPKSRVNQLLPTPSPIISPKPTETNITEIPIEFKQKFDPIDKNIQTQINFNPPQIDQDIGL